jgi:hypothetical protein
MENSIKKEKSMARESIYISRAQLEMRDGLRHAYLGDVNEPVIFGLQGALKEYLGAPADSPSMASTLDYIVAAVGG